jgi:hypothetical protein
MIGLRELMSSDNWSQLAPAALPASVAHVGSLTTLWLATDGMPGFDIGSFGNSSSPPQPMI